LAYNEFWKTYEACHNANFPFIRQRFNKSIHKKQPFMTQGLLVSRNTKNKLHKLSISNPEAATIERYKTYKTLYLKTVRGAKKLYFTVLPNSMQMRAILRKRGKHLMKF
jgi:hypothetical protein